MLVLMRLSCRVKTNVRVLVFATEEADVDHAGV